MPYRRSQHWLQFLLAPLKLPHKQGIACHLSLVADLVVNSIDQSKAIVAYLLDVTKSLLQVNPDSKVSMELVAQAGIGTVASGLTKALAKANASIHHGQISGHDGAAYPCGEPSMRFAM